MPELDVAEQLRAFLITNNVAVPAASANGIDPVIFCTPRDGAPLPIKPANGPDYSAGTITLTTPTEPSAGEDHSRVRTIVSIVVRTQRAPQALLITRAIQAVLTPLELWGGRQMFPMGAITNVDLCLPFRGCRQVSADMDGYVYELAYEFLIRRRLLST